MNPKKIEKLMEMKDAAMLPSLSITRLFLNISTYSTVHMFSEYEFRLSKLSEKSKL